MCHKLSDLAQGSSMTRTSTIFYTLAPPWDVGQASSHHRDTWMLGWGSVAIGCSCGMLFSRMLLEPPSCHTGSASFVHKTKCYPGEITLQSLKP